MTFYPTFISFFVFSSAVPLDSFFSVYFSTHCFFLSNCLHFFPYRYSLGVTNFHSHFILSLLPFSLLCLFCYYFSSFLYLLSSPTFSTPPPFMSPFPIHLSSLSSRLTPYLSCHSFIHILFTQPSITGFPLTLLPFLFLFYFILL